MKTPIEKISSDMDWDLWAERVRALVSASQAIVEGDNSANKYPDIPRLPVPHVETVLTKLVKVEDACWSCHLLAAYVFQKVFVDEVTINLKSYLTLAREVTEVVTEWAVHRSLWAEAKLALSRALTIAGWIGRITRFADAVTVQRRALKRIRFYSREAKLDMIDHYLHFGQRDDGHARTRSTVSTRL